MRPSAEGAADRGRSAALSHCSLTLQGVKDIYLDHNATTRPDPAVVEGFLPFLGDRFGNPASSHARGRAAAAAIEDARESVARLLGCLPSHLTWTSGATEALNTALKGVAARSPRGEIVVSQGEHRAVLDTAEALEVSGLAKVHRVPLLPSGEPDYEGLARLLSDLTVLVCVTAANNETGVLTDLERVAELTHRTGALFLCDATQQVGKLPIDLSVAGVDLAAASAHKLYGPQGVGVLVGPPKHSSMPLEPLIHGGGHQGGLRSGTLNLPGIVGFGKAGELALDAFQAGEPQRLTDLRQRLEGLLEKHAGPVTVHGENAPRLPNTVNVHIHGVDSEALMANCPDVAMSSGSACTSAVPHPSHVLTAMGLSSTTAEESVRLSLGRYTTEAEIDRAAELLGAAARRIRELSA